MLCSPQVPHAKDSTKCAVRLAQDCPQRRAKHRDAPKLDLREVSNLSSQRRQDLLELSCTVPLLLDHRGRGLGHKALVGQRLLAASELLLRRGDLLLQACLLG